MPVLSRFYGIIIRMYFLQSEHNPPHIHAIYNDDVAAIDYMKDSWNKLGVYDLSVSANGQEVFKMTMNELSDQAFV